MQNKTTKDALLSIINRLKNSKIVFKSLYEKNKEKFDRIEENIDNFETDLDYLNKALNIYKWLLFISKTKEELIENMELLIKKPDGTPIEMTDDMRELFSENSKAFQTFILLLEFCRTKYADFDFESEENMKLFKELKQEQATAELEEILEDFIKNENEQDSIYLQEGGKDLNLNMKDKFSYINDKKAYNEYIKYINQAGVLQMIQILIDIDL